MKGLLLILLGVLIGYQVGKAAGRRADAFGEDRGTMTGKGKKLAGIAAAASMSAVHRVRSSASH